MRKAINFDIDTKKYEKYTGKKASAAYAEIKKFMLKNGFEHRQGSGYISEKSLNDKFMMVLISKMSINIKWLKHCIKKMDITNIGNQHSAIDIIMKAVSEDDLLDINEI